MNSKYAKDPNNSNSRQGKEQSDKVVELSFMELLKYGYRSLEYVKDDYLYLGLGFTALITNSITNLSFPWLIGQAVDKASKGQSSIQFKSFLFSTSLVIILGSISSLIRVYCLGTSSFRIISRMKQALFESFLQQDLEFFDQSRCGELITILDKDIQLASQIYTDILTSTLRSLNSAINGSILLYLNSPKLCLVTLSSVPIVGVGAMFMAINSSRQSHVLHDLTSQSLTNTIEKLQNVKTIKINGKESLELENFKNMLQKCFNSAQSMYKAQGAFMSYLNLTTNACLILVLYVGGSMLGSGEITSGNLTSFALQTGFVGLGYSGLSTAYTELRQALISCYRFYQTLEDKKIRQNKKMLTEDSSLSDNSLTTLSAFLPTAVISLRDVSYSYPTRSEYLVLRNITMTFRMQSIHVIIGKNGSGKSTLLSILCGLYTPSTGEVNTCGSGSSFPSSKLSLDWVRENIGVVEQSAKLFSGTIRENICYGSQRQVTQSKIEEVAQSVDAHDFIVSLPDGYDTQVGEGGQMLSGGQRARVALARALIKDPAILILDEPSAALDSECEETLIKLLQKFQKSKCIIIFTHSEAIMSIANQLYLLDQGTVVASGTYEDLMKNKIAEREIALLSAGSLGNK